jgi:predicted permease
MRVSDALQGVLTLLLLIAAGAYMTRRHYLNEETEGKLSTLTLRFSAPCLLFLNCRDNLSLELLSRMGFTLFIPPLTILASCALGWGAARLFRVPAGNRGLFLVLFSMSNTIFIGLPVCMAIFGERALPLVSVYFPFNLFCFWTLGAMGLSKDGGAAFRFDFQTARRIFSPPLLGALLGTAFALLGWNLPGFLSEALRHIGSLTTPVSMFVTGSILMRMGKSAFAVPREGWLALSGRFLIAPGLTLASCLLLNAPPLTTQVFTLEAAMPAMSQSLLVARSVGANHRLAAQMITLTTLIGLALTPLLVYLLTLVT